MAEEILKKIPIITKEDIRENFEDFKSKDFAVLCDFRFKASNIRNRKIKMISKFCHKKK